ncbi:hypothetical protein [Nonomuraea guangzhouensis]|uniref:Asp23/Gls24 family envelope stress response protein n=1 Tax=Nonomuraea guangzhouensis TaxID=1291555 RepID=A0ABW4G174_9ACTN|nr:hypothetical protein [Nonomuraea guangzhouensis]
MSAAQTTDSQVVGPEAGGPEAGGAQVTEVRLIGERAVACAGVAGLSGGLIDTVATYLPGERLTGVSADDHEVNIAIVARLDRPLPETAEEVRRAVADLAGDRLVNIRIDDVVPADTPAAPEDAVKETS